MARLVSKIYGEALYDFAKENNGLKKMCDDARVIVKVFEDSKDLNEFIANPKISTDDKVKFLRDLFTNKFLDTDDQKILDFLSLVIKKGRQKEIVLIFKYFIHLTLKNENIGEAEVTTATELSDDKKKQLEKKLIATTGYKEFRIDYKIDKSLIAGIKIKVDDKVYDNTIKTKLFDINKSLRGLQYD